MQGGKTSMDETKPVQELWLAVDAMLPPGWRSGAAATVLDGLSFIDASLSLEANDQFTLTTTIGSITPLDLRVPGLADFGITIGEFDDVGFTLSLEYAAGVLAVSADDVPITIYLPDTILKPVDDDSALALSGQGTFRISSQGEVRILLEDGLDLTPCHLGEESGLVISASGLQLDLSVIDNPPEVMAAGFDESFVGLYFQEVRVTLPTGFSILVPQDLVLKKCGIGSGGVSGELDVAYNPTYEPNSKTFSGPGAGDLFGIPFGLEHIGLVLRKNSFTKSSFAGELLLPFFDEPVDVEIGVAADGGLTVGLDSATGLAALSIPGVLSIELDSLKFNVDDGVLTATMSGKLTPTVPGLTWPAIDIKELTIDSKGHVNLPGGWLDLPDQYGLDFHGFQVDITKFGLGRNEDGTKWIGFSGGIKLVDGLPAGASVEGLRITAADDWSGPTISFNGVGVELDIPGVLYFKGDVAYREFEVATTGEKIHRFDGDIELDLRSLKLKIDGYLVVGSVAATQSMPAYNFFAIYVGVELPTGVPLGATGLGFYGFDGLLAIEMEPGKLSDEPWYGIAAGEGWYKRPTPGVADLEKWRNQLGSKAFGAGVTFGTYADNGETFNGKALLAIVFPGPIILLEGKANLLKDRAKLNDPNSEPLFRALAVLDNRAKSLLIGLDAKYQFGSTGELITISGGAEAFYDFVNPLAWHIHLGERDPRERRIQARLFALLDANSYFMLDAYKLAMGAWVGFDKKWKFGPLAIVLQAWAEANAVVSFKPGHFYGDLWLHGSVDLEAFSFGIRLTVDARLAADVFKPFHILGEFSVGINLPWPLKDISADVSIEWGPEHVQPPTPIALKVVAIEHFKTSVKWPLPAASTLLVPNYDNGEGYYQTSTPTYDPNAPPPTNAPLVPLDCRPSIAFARNVHDDAQIGLIVQPPDPEWEWIGDPDRNQGPVQIRYGLSQVRLDRWDAGTWTAVAGKGDGISNLPALFGKWALVPGASGAGVGQNKLLLWSKTAFDHTRHTGAEWGNWFANADAYADFPCSLSPASRICLDFERFDMELAFSPLIHPDRAEVRFEAPQVPGTVNYFWVTTLTNPVAGKRKGLRTNARGPLTIAFDHPVNNLRIAAMSQRPLTNSPIIVYVRDKNDNRRMPFPLVDNVVDIDVTDVMSAVLVPPDAGSLHLLEVCADFGPALLESIKQHNEIATAAVWRGVGNVLQPYTNYRLRIVTSIEVLGDFNHVDFNKKYEPAQYAFFQTGAPPGIGALTPPIGSPEPPEFQSGLDDLTRYVHQTVPPTVPAMGEKPLLPRPVYRGYDVGVQFNEDYVDLMYRLAGRDLSLLLYDRNNLPVRDQSGRLVVMTNPWGVAEKLTLSANEQQWLSLLDGKGCVDAVDLGSIPHDQTLSAAAETQVLDADTLYDARLVPLLLHEDFGKLPAGASASGPAGKLGRWSVEDIGIDGPSTWRIEEFGAPPARRIIQTSGIRESAPSAGVAPLGTMLVLDQPGWGDYRISLYLRSSTGTGSIGLAFRYHSVGTFYLFVLDLQNSQCRLVSVSRGAKVVVAEGAFTASLNRDYHLVVEAIGPSLRIYIDDSIVFDVTDSTISNGGLALRCNENIGAAFSDVQVHDFSRAAGSVY